MGFFVVFLILERNDDLEMFFKNMVCILESASASFKHGLVMLSLPLPSRNELCEFALKPITHSVKDVVQFIKDEDGGVERAAIYNTDGNRVSLSTPVEILMQNDFKIVINEREFDVVPPKEGIFCN